MRLTPAPLEDWLRTYYFSTRFDLGSSGVECWSFAELRELLELSCDELDAIVFDDSDSFGDEPLRRAIARRWSDGDADRVMVTHGSSEAIFLVMNGLLAAGDEVVVVDPCYHALSAVAEAIGCRLVRWRLEAERGFAPDLDALRRLVGPRTRMVVVNFPHNPSGATLTPGEQRDLLEIARGVGAYVVWDGALTDLTYDAAPLPDPSVSYERCLTLGTFSKAYGLPGLRVGWCISDRATLASFLPLRDRMTLCLSPLVELVAERAAVHADRLVRPRLAQAGRNLATLAEWAAERDGLVEWATPRGGVTAFPALRVPGCDVESLCHELGGRHEVLLVPGGCFGHPDRVRLGFGGGSQAFAEGLSRLDHVMRRS